MPSNKTEIQYVVGDATEPIGSGYKYIVHVVNNVGAWGKGFTAALDAKWPLLGEDYRENWRLISWPGIQTLIGVAPDEIAITSIMAQNGLRSADNPQPVSYPALDEGLRFLADSILKDWDWRPSSVHMPRIGCGLGGGQWSEVSAMIENRLCAEGG
jgi:O-acetyl-ADP-ribose deacetylase (regulator of RNase III)